MQNLYFAVIPAKAGIPRPPLDIARSRRRRGNPSAPRLSFLRKQESRGRGGMGTDPK